MAGAENILLKQEMLTGLFESVKVHLRSQYEGVFSDAQLARHFNDYIELGLSEGQLSEIQKFTELCKGVRLLDLGCGFGSFVLVCRKAGIEAVGLEVADFELHFARKRLSMEMPALDAASVYLHGDACSSKLEDQTWDIVSAWNLLEHVGDSTGLFREVYRLLKPGGILFGVAPNYLAFREEAHYQVPWVPLLPGFIARRYLRGLGRRTDFFDTQVHYVTNWGILRSLQRAGFRLSYPSLFKMENPNLIKSPFRSQVIRRIRQWHMAPILKIFLLAAYWNPLKRGVYFVARKPK